MDEIRVIPKPDWVSWDDIHAVLEDAHKVNRKHGLEMINSHLNGEQLKKKIGNGICVVALDGNKVIGTQSVLLKEGDKWYSKGQKVAHYCLTGVLRRYQGCGIKEMLDSTCKEYILKELPSIIQGNTAESNVLIRKMVKSSGYIELCYDAFKNTDYYSVFFARWPNGCPYSLWYCRFRCWLSKVYVKTRFKPGKIERFHFIAVLNRLINQRKKL